MGNRGREACISSGAFLASIGIETAGIILSSKQIMEIGIVTFLASGSMNLAIMFIDKHTDYKKRLGKNHDIRSN